jgi:hypothetical protein
VLQSHESLSQRTAARCIVWRPIFMRVLTRGRRLAGQRYPPASSFAPLRISLTAQTVLSTDDMAWKRVQKRPSRPTIPLTLPWISLRPGVGSSHSTPGESSQSSLPQQIVIRVRLLAHTETYGPSGRREVPRAPEQEEPLAG